MRRQPRCLPGSLPPPRLLLGLCAGLLLAGCGSVDRMSTSAIPMQDYRVRHPIVLAETPNNLDLFPSPHGLDRRSAAQVQQFAEQYRAAGQGPISILVPTIGRSYAQRDVAAIRRALAAAGVAAPLQVTTYPVANPGLASPIRLSFVGLKAKVANRCGEWPSDLASGSSVEGWDNKPYWNLGCATQSALAAQVADPRDLVTPAPDEPADTMMRSRSIAAIRKGTDPVTDWKTKNSSISPVGSN